MQVPTKRFSTDNHDVPSIKTGTPASARSRIWPFVGEECWQPTPTTDRTLLRSYTSGCHRVPLAPAHHAVVSDLYTDDLPPTAARLAERPTCQSRIRGRSRSGHQAGHDLSRQHRDPFHPHRLCRVRPGHRPGARRDSRQRSHLVQDRLRLRPGDPVSRPARSHPSVDGGCGSHGAASDPGTHGGAVHPSRRSPSGTARLPERKPWQSRWPIWTRE